MILMGPKGRQWLQSNLERFGKLVDVYDVNSPVRLFLPDTLSSYGNDSATTYYFDCNYAIGKSRHEIEQFFNYNRLKMSYEKLSPMEFTEVRKKIWKNKPSKYDTQLNNYLLPEFAKLDKPVSLSDTFSLVEYNLR